MESSNRAHIQGLSIGWIADAIVNFKSLDDVAKQALAQIAADLLRMQIQKAISGIRGLAG